MMESNNQAKKTCIRVLVGIVIVCCVSFLSILTMHLLSNQTLSQNALITLISKEDMDEDLKRELRSCVKEDENYEAKYYFSWAGGTPHIEFVFTLPSVPCACGLGTTPERIVTLDCCQHLGGGWYILDSSVEYR